MNALRSISAQARKFRIRFFILPFPPRPLRWVSSEYALRSISAQARKFRIRFFILPFPPRPLTLGLVGVRAPRRFRLKPKKGTGSGAPGSFFDAYLF